MEITLENGLIMENGVVKSGKNCEGDIVLPEDAKAIAPKAFYNNKKITSLTLPEGLPYPVAKIWLTCSYRAALPTSAITA